MLFNTSVKDGVVDRVMRSLEDGYNNSDDEVCIITIYSCLQAPPLSEGTLTLKEGISLMYFNQP